MAGVWGISFAVVVFFDLVARSFVVGTRVVARIILSILFISFIRKRVKACSIVGRTCWVICSRWAASLYGIGVFVGGLFVDGYFNLVIILGKKMCIYK